MQCRPTTSGNTLGGVQSPSNASTCMSAGDNADQHQFSPLCFACISWPTSRSFQYYWYELLKYMQCTVM